METLKCIVPYKSQSYSKIKALSEVNITRIMDAKAKRESFGGDNVQAEQTNQIPEVLNTDIHGIHMEPCYKQYVC